MAKIYKRFRLPEGCDCNEVVMRQLDARDERQAAVMADIKLASGEKDSVRARAMAEQMEAIKLSLVQVDGSPVNVDGAPFDTADGWSQSTLGYLNSFYTDMNGMDVSEAKKSIAGAELVDPASL